jgi:hypothetical protein
MRMRRTGTIRLKRMVRVDLSVPPYTVSSDFPLGRTSGKGTSKRKRSQDDDPDNSGLGDTSSVDEDDEDEESLDGGTSTNPFNANIQHRILMTYMQIYQCRYLKPF